MSFRSPIFRKLLASAALLAAVTLLVVDFYFTRYTSRREVEQVEQRLSLEARVLAGELNDHPPDRLAAWSREAEVRAQARVTLIDPRGVVLADSQHDPETMENHANRPEVQEAKQKQIGKSIRHSATLNRDLCYVALLVRYRDEPGHVLRLAVPLEELDTAIAAVRSRILGTSLLAAGLALAIAYFFSRSLSGRVRRLEEFAEGLVDAHFSKAPLPAEDDELGALARSLNRMAAQLRDLVEQLSLESSRREAILASMVEGVLAVDSDLRVTFCNDSFARAVAAPAPVAERLPLVDLVRDPGLIDLLGRVLRSGESQSERVELSAAPGRAFEVEAAPLAAPSGRGAIAILHDITELERLERVRKDFVANVSHELRTPLTAIRGYAETLLEGALEDHQNNRRFVEIIKSHAIRLDNIARDLLTLSELESGKAPSEPERCSVREALESGLRTVESEARLRGVDLRPGPVEEADVKADPMRLEQALVNLLDNAVKFNRPGGEVRAEACLTSDGKVRISVSDTGIGIPSRDLPRIFERFYRVDKARSRDVSGTGLGLSIVKHIVERMNGTVAVESELGKGSTFTVVLPAT